MKLTWKNNKKRSLPAVSTKLLFGYEEEGNSDDLAHQQDETKDEQFKKDDGNGVGSSGQVGESIKEQTCHLPEAKRLAQQFQAQGDKLAQDGKYREALSKWEASLTLMPENAVIHEQKAQVLLEVGDAWNALKAATRATELEQSWVEAWITLGRAQLNFGEPDSAIESFDKALALKPDCKEAPHDRQTASHLVKKRKQLHLSGLSTSENRFVVGDKSDSS